MAPFMRHDDRLDAVFSALSDPTRRRHHGAAARWEAYASRASFGAPPFEVDGWVSSYTAIAKGELDVVSDDIQFVVGRRATTLPEFLSRYRESYAHLRVRA
jgi:hypothetical protein